MKTGLVLEGGGMRGVYTVGVLDYFLQQDFFPDYIVGVSAGAANAVSYITKQKGRGYSVNVNYLNDKRYLSFKNFLKTGSVFGMDLIFDEIPNKIEPLDYNELQKSKCEFKVGATDVDSGKTVYFDKQHLKDNCLVLRASSSIPILSPIVEYQGNKYLDGGITDPIPFKKALEDGCDKIIVVLTQPRGYIKKPQKYKFLYEKIYKNYPMIVEALKTRHIKYNKTLYEIDKLEKQGKALVIAPSREMGIGRYEKDINKLNSVFNLGINDAKNYLFINNKQQN